MKTDTERKRGAILRVLCNAHKLHKVGGGFMLNIPSAWRRLYALEVDGEMWVSVVSSSGKLIIEPVDEKRALNLMEANNVRPTQSS